MHLSDLVPTQMLCVLCMFCLLAVKVFIFSIFQMIELKLNNKHSLFSPVMSYLAWGAMQAK